MNASCTRSSAALRSSTNSRARRTSDWPSCRNNDTTSASTSRRRRSLRTKGRARVDLESAPHPTMRHGASNPATRHLPDRRRQRVPRATRGNQHFADPRPPRLTHHLRSLPRMSPAPAFRPPRNERRSFVRRLNGRSRITGSLSIGSVGVTSADRLPPGPGGSPGGTGYPDASSGRSALGRGSSRAVIHCVISSMASSVAGSFGSSIHPCTLCG